MREYNESMFRNYTTVSLASGILLGLAAMLSFTGPGHAGDRHAGYYYPEPQSEETYQAPLPVLPGVSRLSRVGFVTQLDQLQKNVHTHLHTTCLQKAVMQKN